MSLELNLQRGLVGHWTMDNQDISSGNVYDSSAADPADAAIAAGVTTGNTGSPLGEHTESDGSGDSYIGTRYFLDTSLSTNISISTWVKDIGNANGRYFSTDLSEYFGAWNSGTAGNIRMRMTDANNDYYDDTATINTGEWHHIAMVWDDTVPEYRTYLDGNLFNSQSLSNSTFGTGSYKRYLILHDGSESNNFNTNQNVASDCGLSDFRVYHRALSADEVSALYQMRSQRNANI